jgi:hypothetical protein
VQAIPLSLNLSGIKDALVRLPLFQTPHVKEIREAFLAFSDTAYLIVFTAPSPL